MAVPEEVSTIFIGGIPPDATLREMDNLCRFMPGYVHSKVDSRKGKRPRMFEDPNGIDTVAIVGAADRGFSEAAIEGFFAQIPGFMAFKSNPRMGGGFAKFTAPVFAMEAVNAALPEGIPAEIAKSSMSSVGGGGGGGLPPAPAVVAQHYPMAAVPAVDPWAAHAPQDMAQYGGPKRPRIPEDPQGIDTIAIIGAEDRGFPIVAVEAFFSAIPGFVAFKPNPRMGGGFAKFASGPLAAEAVSVAIAEGIPVEMAKSSMGSPGGAGGCPMPPPQQYAAPHSHEQWAAAPPQGGSPVPIKRPRIPENPGCVDTLAIVGATDRGFDEETLRAFFAGCPGFVVFKPNPRMGGGFAKFESPQAASEAVSTAMAEGVPAAIAKSSMSNLA